MSLMTTTVCDHWTKVLPLLNVLKKLYTINSLRVTQLPEGYFFIKELSDFFDLVPLIFNEQLEISFLQSTVLLINYPFILDIKSKCTVFHILQMEYGQNFPLSIQNTLCVNRETVLADTLVYLKTNSHDFSLPLKVKFSLEDGFDDGGLRAEFFTLLGQEMTKDSSVIQVFEDSGLFWFSADDSGSSLEELYYIGVICGLAFYNHCFMNVGFPVALFKKLLNLSPTFSDLEELSPVEARSLKTVLTEDEDVVEELYLDFTVKGKELIPNGAEIPVTKANRQKYMDLYIDKSVENQFKKFEEGFFRGNPFGLWMVFKPEELKDLLSGTSKYEWEELQKGVRYEHCGPSDELVQNFWSVFLELNEEHQKKFLTFVYGTDRLPVGGLSNRRLKIVRCNYEDADDRFPLAQTCYGVVHLPNYSNIPIL